MAIPATMKWKPTSALYQFLQRTW